MDFEPYTPSVPTGIQNLMTKASINKYTEMAPVFKTAKEKTNYCPQLDRQPGSTLGSI